MPPACRAQLLAWAPGANLPADGTTMTPLILVAVDRFGQGVPGVAIDLRIDENSTGWVTPSATTNDAGVAVVDYRAGHHFGPARILVRSKGLESNAIVYLHDGQSDPPTAPPPSALQVRWMERVASTRLSRQRPADKPAPEVGPKAIQSPPVASAPSLSTGPVLWHPPRPNHRPRRRDEEEELTPLALPSILTSPGSMHLSPHVSPTKTAA